MRKRRPVVARAPAPRDSLLDQVHDAVISTDLQGIIRSWNRAAERIYGYTEAEAVGQPITMLYAAEDLADVQARVFEPTLRDGICEVTLRNRRKDGVAVTIALRLSVQRDAAGRPVGVVGCSHDVTGEDRVRDDLARQREELRAILDGMPAMVWFKDKDNRILRANRAAAAVVGASPEDLEGRSTYDLFPDGAAKYHRDDLEVIAAGRPKLGIVETLTRADGATRWVRTDKLPHRDERGDMTRVLVFAVDITEQKAAEAELKRAREELEQRVQARTAALARAVDQLREEVAQRQQAEERLELALWATDLAMWSWDGASGETISDLRWLEQLGYELGGGGSPSQRWQELTHPEDQAEIVDAWTAHVVDGTAPHYEVEQRVRAANGEYRWFLVRGKVVERGPDGTALRVVGTRREITSRKLAAELASRRQAELAHLLRLQTVNCLAAELAHEINQPLGAIANFANGLAERLRQGQLDRDTLLDAAERIGRQALRAGAVLQRMREFVRKDEVPPARCEVGEIARAAAEFVEGEARRHRVALTLHVQADLPPVLADRIQIEQVLVNLLHNAIEAVAGSGAGGGQVTLETRLGDAGVTLCVHDTGAGLPERLRAMLFEPFFTTKPGGLGMGLSISRSIIEGHGGRLWADPRPGPGATFCFTLPPHVASGA